MHIFNIILTLIIVISLLGQIYLHKKMGGEDERARYLVKEMQRIAALLTLFFIFIGILFFNLEKINNLLLMSVALFCASGTLYGFKLIK
ncbi:hypothetical protein [Staphylococcus cohnii]|uniref:hypothetical protein n=1 Tax=Staphylococcus cohnii TaxID=29382 RepID=UPI0018665D31|nr:hypothetical protein [Staphylococcus cohnii]